MIVAASLPAGVLGAFTLVAAPFAGGSEPEITGAVLIGSPSAGACCSCSRRA